jgi:hypothetical protein
MLLRTKLAYCAEKADRKPDMAKLGARDLEELQRVLLALHDELTETHAWTALLYDGLCGILGENGTDIDPTTHSGVRFATTWLKQRNKSHAATLQAACKKLREIRDR